MKRYINVPIDDVPFLLLAEGIYSSEVTAKAYCNMLVNGDVGIRVKAFDRLKRFYGVKVYPEAAEGYCCTVYIPKKRPDSFSTRPAQDCGTCDSIW